LKAILRQIKKETQFKDMELDHYTWHSFRIFLCTALINNDESHATVQAMCRWQTPQSIHDYGTVDATRYCNILLGAMNKNPATARGAYLAAAAAPAIDVPEEDLAEVAHYSPEIMH
jgi:hypothetical protein